MPVALSTPSAPALPERRSFPERFRAEAAGMYLPDSDPAGTELRLHRLAASLAPQQVAWLRQRALDRHAPPAERYLALYLLGGAPGSLEELVQAALADDESFHAPAKPHSRAQARRRFETALRLKAIDAISNANGAVVDEKKSALARIAASAPSTGLREEAALRLNHLHAEERL